LKALRTVLVIALAVLTGGEAMAHAVLLETVPADRAVVSGPPGEIVMRFNEGVDPVSVRVLDGDGRLIGGAVSARDGAVKFTPAAELGRGAYLVSWRVISADAHPIAGAFQFAIGATPLAWQAAPADNGDAWIGLVVLNRALNLVALTLLIGGALYGALIAAPPRRVLQWAAAGGALTAILAVGLEGGLVLQPPLGAIFSMEPWRLGASTTRGLAAAVAVLGCGLVAVRLPLIGAALAATSFLLSGHVATAPPRLVSMPALLIHVVLAAFWLGSFLPLLVAAPGEGRRYGRLFRWMLPVLATAGLVIAAVQIRALPPLWDTSYGLLLLAKVVLVMALVGLVLHHRGRMRGRAFVAAELTLGVLILGATAILSETTPPRSRIPSSSAAAVPVVQAPVVVRSGRFVATIAVAPGRPGRNAITATIADTTGQLAAPLEVAALISNPAAGIEEITRPLVRGADGAWRYQGPEFAVPGAWTVRIEALVSDFEKVSFVGSVSIR
jgi:copper transport protein